MRLWALGAAVLALGTAAVGCGGGNANGVLAQTASKLADVRSGDLTVRLLAEGGGTRAGFELTGPFALPKTGQLPVARLDYTQIAGAQQATVTLVSTGQETFVQTNGSAYVLPAEQADQLRAAGASLGGAGSGSGAGEGLGVLQIEDWLVDPEVSDGGEVGGAETDHISAELDVVQAANDLLVVASAIRGGTAERIEDADAERLRRAVEDGRIDVWTGKDDRLLRRLVVDVRLTADAPDDLRRKLGALGKAHLRFELAVANPNEPVQVEAPANAQPFPASATG